MITNALRGQLQAQTERFLTETCLIEARSNTVGEYGEPTQDSWTTVASGVTCRVITVGTRYRESATATAGRESITDVYRLVCPAGTALAVDQRVTITSTGLTYQIVDLNTSRTDETDTQAIIVRVQ